MSDFENDVIFEIDPLGNVTTFATDFSFSSTPYHKYDGGDIVFGPDGAMYIADGGAGTVWRIYCIESDEYHVDAVNGDDDNIGITRQTAFATIGKGVEVAEDGDVVLVWPGVYGESVNFVGKAITVRSAAEAAVIDTGIGVWADSGEEPSSVLANFIIKNCAMGAFCVDSSPTLRNLTVVNNDYGIVSYGSGGPDVVNCIFWNNSEEDLYGCDSRYSFLPETMPDNLIEGVVAYWNFDDGAGSTALDSVGSNHGTVSGAQWVSGHTNGALNFDGSNDYVEVNEDSTLQGLGASIFSMSAWIYPTAVNSTYSIVRNDQDYIMFILNGKLRGEAFKSNTLYHEETGSNTIASNTWCHVAVVWDGADFQMYINGTLHPSTTSHYSYTMHPHPLWIGRSSEYNEPFPGSIDEVVIFNRVLSAGEVTQIYQNGLTVPNENTTEPLFANAETGDYHLRSERGRYDPGLDMWVLDEVSSPAVDGGDPTENPMGERMPNGARFNMGAYGGTAWASMSEWPTAADVNRDGVVNLVDYALWAEKWLWAAEWVE
ncbi:MAG: LamG domain-containing protein [Sedimentisphaerales bacterium]|nr:LamG domain-containing protein [Sedimentisphaerales bacterium]